MALYRLVCAFGHQSLVTMLTRCGLLLPTYFLADEKHSHSLTDKVYLPTIVCGRVIWHLGYTMGFFAYPPIKYIPALSAMLRVPSVSEAP